MSIEALQKINNNYHTALAVHRELADVFWFIYVPGYALWMEYQLLQESMTQRKLKRYIASTYHVFSPDVLPQTANISEPLLKGKNRKTLKMEDMWQIIQQSFQAYCDFEEKNLQMYQKTATEILAKGDVAVLNFVSEIIRDVKAELTYVVDKQIELCAHDYDMPTIVGEQADYFERYSKLIGGMFKKKNMMNLHHSNSALDVHSRVEESYV